MNHFLQDQNWPLFTVLRVAHLFHPINILAIERFLNRNMRHSGSGRCAVPVFFTRRKPHHVPRPNLLDLTAFGAYAEAGFSSNRGNAARLKANEDILARVSELQERAKERFHLSKQFVIDAHIENAEKALGRRPVLLGKPKEDGSFDEVYVYEGAVANAAIRLAGMEMSSRSQCRRKVCLIQAATRRHVSSSLCPPNVLMRFNRLYVLCSSDYRDVVETLKAWRFVEVGHSCAVRGNCILDKYGPD